MPDNAPSPTSPALPASPEGAQLDQHIKAWAAANGRKGGRLGGHRWTKREASEAANVRWARQAKPGRQD